MFCIEKKRMLKLITILGTIHIWYPWKLSNFQDPRPPMFIYVQNFFSFPWPWTSSFKRTLQPSLANYETMWANEMENKQNQVTSHSNWPRVLLFDLAHKQCNGIIKRWLHCLAEAIGRFLVNNNLMFDSAWCLVMAQTQYSLIEKIKIGRPGHSLLSPPYVV